MFLKRLSVPHSTFEPELDPSTHLQLDLLAALNLKSAA